MSREESVTGERFTEASKARIRQVESENESLKKINKTLVEEVKSKDEVIKDLGGDKAKASEEIEMLRTKILKLEASRTRARERANHAEECLQKAFRMGKVFKDFPGNPEHYDVHTVMPPVQEGPAVIAQCENCGKPESSGRKLLQCSKCRHARYCTKECQRSHWRTQVCKQPDGKGAWGTWDSPRMGGCIGDPEDESVKEARWRGALATVLSLTAKY